MLVCCSIVSLIACAAIARPLDFSHAMKRRDNWHASRRNKLHRAILAACHATTEYAVSGDQGTISDEPPDLILATGNRQAHRMATWPYITSRFTL